MKKYISVILAGVFMFACTPPDPSISSSIETLEIGETYPEHVVKINSNFANLNTDKLEDAPSNGSQYARQDGAWSVVTGGTGAVSSVFGRTGAVVAVGADYGSFYEVLLSCSDGQIKKWSSGAWVCAADDSGTGGAVDSVFGRTGVVVAVGTDYAAYYESLLTGCNIDQVKKWNGSAWACADDDVGSGSMPPGNAVNDIMQWDGSIWAVQGFINGLIDDTAGNGDTTAVWSADKVFDELALVNGVPDGGATGQVLGKVSNTDQDLAWIDQTGSGGGVSSIIAGTNVTIAPTSGLGDVTINAVVSAVGGYVPIPAHSDEKCIEGQYAIDRANDYIYWCYATDSWDRVPSTFDQWDDPAVVFYDLTISPAPTNGRVTEPSDSSNINCGTGGNDCDHGYEDGTDVVLHSIPESGYALNVWSGTNLTDNGDGTATVHIDQDISDVTATFQAVASYTDIIMYWDAETTTMNNVDAAGNTLSLHNTAELSADISPPSGLTSTYALKAFGGSADYAQIQSINIAGFNESEGAIGFYTYLSVATATDDNTYFNVIVDSSNQITFDESSGGNYIKFIGAGINVSLHGATPTGQQWVWVEYRWKDGGLDGGSNTFELYHDNVLIDSKTDTVPTMSDIITLNMGAYKATTDTMYYDQFMVTNDPDNRRLWDVRNVTSF